MASTTVTHQYYGADKKYHGTATFSMPGWAWDDVFGCVFVTNLLDDGMYALRAPGSSTVRHRSAGHVRALTTGDPMPSDDDSDTVDIKTPVRRQLTMRNPSSVTTEELSSIAASSQETTLSQESLGSTDTPSPRIIEDSPPAISPNAQTPASTPVRKAHSVYFNNKLSGVKGRRALRHTRRPKLYRWDYAVRGVGVCTFGGVDDGVSLAAPGLTWIVNGTRMVVLAVFGSATWSHGGMLYVALARAEEAYPGANILPGAVVKMLVTDLFRSSLPQQTISFADVAELIEIATNFVAKYSTNPELWESFTLFESNQRRLQLETEAAEAKAKLEKLTRQREEKVRKTLLASAARVKRAADKRNADRAAQTKAALIRRKAANERRKRRRVDQQWSRRRQEEEKERANARAKDKEQLARLLAEQETARKERDRQRDEDARHKAAHEREIQCLRDAHHARGLETLRVQKALVDIRDALAEMKKVKAEVVAQNTINQRLLQLAPPVSAPPAAVPVQFQHPGRLCGMVRPPRHAMVPWQPQFYQ